MSEMKETPVTYLRRVLPDIEALTEDVQAAIAHEGSHYYLSSAIGKAQKLLEDLQRAEHSEPMGPEGTYR
jgi:hypothetical protein